MRIRNIILTALALGTLLPAAASAQGFGWGYHYDRPPSPTYGFINYGPPPAPRADPHLIDRESHLQNWMRRGSEEGWLTGWRAERAWGDLHAIKAETYQGNGFDGYQIGQRLDHLADFVRHAHDDPWG